MRWKYRLPLLACLAALILGFRELAFELTWLFSPMAALELNKQLPSDLFFPATLPSLAAAILICGKTCPSTLHSILAIAAAVAIGALQLELLYQLWHRLWRLARGRLRKGP